MTALHISLPTVVLSLGILSTHAEEWPQWRGPERDGSSQGAAFPQSLSDDTLTSVWRVDLEPSYSGPIIKNGILYTTETANKEMEVVTAFDLKSGEQKWKSQWEGVMRVPFFAKANGSWIRSTPATDGDRIYVAGMRDVLVCLDAKSGDQLWKFDFVEKFGTDLPSFGFVCSPLLSGNAVIVQAGASVVAINKGTGKVMWRSMEDGGGMNGSAFSSPIISEVGGQEQLLVQTRTELCGLEVGSGEPLWRQKIPAFRGMNILTPIVYNDAVFTTAYGGKAMAVQPKKGAEWEVSNKWELKLEGYMSSPVILDGHAYVHLRNQRFACVDLKYGEEKWVTKEKFGKYWSMISNGNQILALDEKGDLRLIDASPEGFKVRDSRDLGVKECWAHIARSGEFVAVRSLNRLEVFRWVEPKA